MREITSYKCADGTIHTDERKAIEHDNDLLRQELDGLLRLFELDSSRSQGNRALLGIMKKRELAKAVRSVVKVLDSLEDTPC